MACTNSTMKQVFLNFWLLCFKSIYICMREHIPKQSRPFFEFFLAKNSKYLPVLGLGSKVGH
jgi:hypothetical protein